MTSWAKGFGPYGQTGFNPADWEGQLAAKKASQPQLPPNMGDGGAFGPMTNTDVNVMSPRDQARNDIFASLGQSGYGPMTNEDQQLYTETYNTSPESMINVQRPGYGPMTNIDYMQILKGLL